MKYDTVDEIQHCRQNTTLSTKYYHFDIVKRLVIVLSVLLRYADSDYPFDICKLLIIVLSVLLKFQIQLNNHRNKNETIKKKTMSLPSLT
jgi:hypothetical protein